MNIINTMCPIVFTTELFTLSILSQDPFEIIRKGSMEAIYECISKDPSLVNIHDPYFDTLLHAAAIRGHTGAVDVLLHYRAQIDPCNVGIKFPSQVATAWINAPNSDSETPLHVAANWVVALMLIRAGANIFYTNFAGLTPLHSAAKTGNTNIIRILLQAGAHVDPQDCVGATPLHYAATHGYADLVQLLVAKGANVNSQDNNGQTPLHKTCIHGYADIAQMLVAAGADVTIQDHDGRSPLHIIIKKEDAKDFILVLLEGSKTKAKRAHKDPQKALLALVNQQDKHGMTPLHEAALWNNIYAARKFIEAGAQVNKYNGDHCQTPLHLAADNGSEDMTRILIAAGANVNFKDHNYQTPLYYANLHNHNEIARLIINQIKKRRREIGLALAMASHPHLGKKSPLSLLSLSTCLLKAITAAAIIAEESEGLPEYAKKSHKCKKSMVAAVPHQSEDCCFEAIKLIPYLFSTFFC